MTDHNHVAAELRERAAAAHREAIRLEDEAKRHELQAARALRRFRPISPLDPSAGVTSAVITFTRRLSGRDYQYAAVGWIDRRSGRGTWAMTGEESGRFSWVELLDFIEAENWRSIRRVHHEVGLPVRDMKGSGGTSTWGEADEKVRAEEAAKQAYTDAKAGRRSPFDKIGEPELVGLVFRDTNPYAL
ncbi:hypothetical protein SEA_WOOPER_80 [Gordonia phage Wooper]|nr:hypothetical protein SEA_WOOPER_80 [Gordonia phage Wooper]